MRKQYLSQSSKSGEFYSYYTRTGIESLAARLEFTSGQVFERSEIVVNKPKNGYRKPSNYKAARRFNNIVFGNRTVIGSATIAPPKVPIGIRGDYNRMSGLHPVVTRGFGSNVNPSFNSTQALRTKILNNVQGEILDVAMVLAEIGATASTGADLMNRIGRSMQAVARRDIRSFEKLWSGKHPRDKHGRPLTGRYLDRFNRQTADMYLEWKYGIMPTVYDLQGVTKALDANEKGSLWDNPPLLVARAQNVDIVTHSPTAEVIEAGGTTSRIPLTVTDRVTHKARLDFRVEHDLMRGLNRYGLGLTSLATVAWDKTPFTFVFNMVMPIAEIIKAWGAMAGVAPAGYCETWHVDRTYSPLTGSVPCSSRMPGAVSNYQLDSDSEMIMNRVAYPTVPMPLPFIRNPVKVGNIATVLSLFTQMRRKGY